MSSAFVYGWTHKKPLTLPLLLFFIPLFFLGLSLYNLSIQGPFYSFNNVDPSYAYLFNGFELLHFHAPGHVDHPGTTTQIWIAVVIGLKWLYTAGHAWLTQQPIPSLDHLFYTQPEPFLYIAAISLIVFNTILFSIISLNLFRYTKHAQVVFAFQLGLFLFFPVIESFSMFTPEPMLLTALLLLCLTLFPVLLKNRDADTSKYARYFGLSLAFGIVTKVTFLPIAIFAFLFPKNQYKKILLCFCIGFILLTFPIWGRYTNMIKWLISLAFHEGNYGTGAIGIIDNSKISTNFALLLGQIPYLFIGLVGIISYWLCSYKKNAPIINKFLLLSLGAILFSLALTLKHPGIRYIIPVLLLGAPIGAILAYQLKEQKIIYTIVLFGFLLSGTGFAAMQYQNWHHTKLLEAKGRVQFEKYVNTHHCKVVGMYNPSMQSYGLFFGNQWANKKRVAILNQYYPNSIFFDQPSEKFYDFHGPVHHQLDEAQVETQFKQYPCVVFQGYHLTLATDSIYQGRFTEKSLDGNKSQSAKFYDFKVS